MTFLANPQLIMQISNANETYYLGAHTMIHPKFLWIRRYELLTLV